MANWRLLGVIFTLAIAVECRRASHQKREAVKNLCEAGYNNTNSLQCFCVIDPKHEKTIKSADCYLTNKTSSTDSAWNEFENLRISEKLIFSNPRGAPLKYIPTTAIKYVPNILSVTVKYGDVKDIKPYAFSNLSYIQEIILSGNEIEVLHRHAFAHHPQLTIIVLDTNKITEINRDVFIDLPILEKLFLTTNKITTLHDKAFMHLTNLKELELDKNKIFSLNSETFTGLRNLQRLELSGNSLEVIGDNTFTPLVNLHSLNLEGNNIQMLDDKAFKGLSNLQLLSLAHNKLPGLDNSKLFEGLNALISLNLKSNNINYLKSEVIKPILHNFYGASSSFEFNENPFDCDCRLDWFVALSNKTQNSRMKLAIENLQCTPDASLSEKWKKLEDTYKTGGATFDETNGNPGDYEYYDETQLNGKLFYIDVRDILNCSAIISPIGRSGVETTVRASTSFSTPSPLPISQHTTISLSSQSKPNKAKDAVTTPYLTESVTTPRPQTTHAINHGILDLSDETEKYEKTEKQPAVEKNSDKHFPVSREMVRNSDQPKPGFTTSRLATVSAKPSDDNMKVIDDDKMSSDEAAHPDLRTRAERNEIPFDKSGSHNNIGTALVSISILTIFLRLI